MTGLWRLASGSAWQRGHAGPPTPPWHMLALGHMAEARAGRSISWRKLGGELRPRQRPRHLGSRSATQTRLKLHMLTAGAGGAHSSAAHRTCAHMMTSGGQPCRPLGTRTAELLLRSPMALTAPTPAAFQGVSFR